MKLKTAASRFALRLRRKSRLMGGVWRHRFNHLLLLAIGLFGLARTTATELPAVGLWLQAGVEGGIPTGLPVIARVTPADDLQAAIDAAPATGGIIALAAGRYRLTTTLHLRSGVVVRGTGPRTTVLDLALRGTRPADLRQPAPADWTAGLRLEGIERAGLANLALTFDSTLPRPPDPRSTSQVWIDNPAG